MIRPLREIQRGAILEAISKTRGDTAQAAKLLGVSRMTVYRWLHKYGFVSDRRQQPIRLTK